MKKFKEINKPIYIHNKNFRTIIIEMFFPYETKEEYIGIEDILPAMLVHRSEKYPLESDFLKEYLKRYIDVFAIRTMQVGNRSFFITRLVIPDPAYLKEDHIEEAIKFACDAIYHPFIKDGAFDKKYVEKEKTSLLIGIEHQMKNVYGYSNRQFMEIFDEVGFYKNSIVNHKKQIEKITPQKLYQFYREVIQTKKPFTFVFGNVDETKMNQLFEQYIYHGQYEKVEFPKNYLQFKNKVKYHEKTEKGPFHVSRIFMGYKVKDMKEEELPILYMVMDLLTSDSANLILKELRDKRNIVYSAGARSCKTIGGICLLADIHKDNKESALEGMKSVIEDLKKKEIIEPLMKKIIEKFYWENQDNLDNKFSLLYDHIVEYFGYANSDQREYENMKKVTPEEVIEFVNRLELDTIYFLEGEKNAR